MPKICASNRLAKPYEDTVTMTTTKKDIVQQMSERLEAPPVEIQKSVETMFEILGDALVAGEYWEIRNFGVFKTKQRAPRTGRNIHTGEKVPVPSYLDVIFKPGRLMLKRVAQVTRFTEPKRRKK